MQSAIPFLCALVLRFGSPLKESLFLPPLRLFLPNRYFNWASFFASFSERVYFLKNTN